MSLQWKVLIVVPKKLMFALIVLIFSFQIFADGQKFGFERNSIQELDLFDSNLQNFKVEGSGNAQTEKLFRLPSDVKPILYNLKLVPNLYGNFTFFGEVVIDLKIEKSTDIVILHCHKLNISKVEVFRNKRKIDSGYTVSSANQTLTIQTRLKMYRGNDVKLNVTFDGILNDEMMGFYRSSYKVGNTTKWLAITQFEATYARMAFPCFDEPAYRAPFLIAIARDLNQTAMSNMPLYSTSSPDQSIGQRVWDHFVLTPPMPTYLVAFAVTEFKYRTNDAGAVKVWARENAIQETDFALTEASSALKNMEKYVGVPYALPKLDVVAVPDFQAGAMENWGLTTYREERSLFNPKLGSERNKERVTSVIAHEFAHQWFGDLVTLAWWDYVWLNEGFATYFEYFLTDIVEPSWRMNEFFVVDVTQFALNIDGISTHSAMNAKVNSLSDINLKFDGISYDKAGSVIRMIENMVSTNIFKKALQRYQISRKYDVAQPSNLYSAFEEQLKAEGKSFPNPVTLTKVFQSFADQPGYPLIMVSRQRAFDRYNITIKQIPYKSPRSSQSITQKTWVVPLACTKQSQPDFNNTQPTIWLTDENKVVLLNEVRKDEWYICNLQQAGYFRVNYDEENWQLIIKQLHSSHSQIHQLNRAQLINDATTFAKDGFLPYHIMFDLLSYLSHETDPIPWYRGLIITHYFINEHLNSKAYGELLHFLKHLVGHFYSHIGFYEKPEDTHLVKTVRSLLVFLACDMEIDDAVAKAKLEFSSKTDLSQIPASIKEAVLCHAIKTNSDMPVWNKLWDLYRNSSYDFEKVTVLFAVGCATNQTLLKRFLNKTIDKDDHDIRKQDEIWVFRSVTRFPRGVLAVINYVHDFLPHAEHCSHAHAIVMRFLSKIKGKVQSPEQIHRLEHVIEEVEKMNQTRVGDIKETLMKMKENAIKLKTRIDVEAEKILVALTGPSPTTPKPSSASIIVPHIVTLMIIILSSLKLII